MYAVIRTGNKQYRVEKGTELEVERIAGEIGEEISLSDVMLVSDGASVRVGEPVVKGAKVSAKIVSQLRGPKVISFKKLRRHGMRWKKGHRQELTRIRVEEISA